MRIFLAVILLIGLYGPAIAEEQRLEITLDSPVLAARGDTTITFAEMQAALEDIPESDRRVFLEDPDRFIKFLRDRLMEKGLFNDLVRGDMLDDKELRARVFNTAVGQLATLQQERYIDSRLLEDYSKQAREYYLAHPDEFVGPRTVTFGQIALIRTRREGDRVDEIAGDLVTRLESGAELEPLAREWSDDPAVDRNGGIYTDMSLNRMNKFLAEALRDMRPGAIEKVDTGRSILIVKLLDTAEPERIPFEEVADRLKRQERARHREQLTKDYLEDQYAGELEIPDGAIRRFLGPYGAEWNTPIVPADSE